MKAVRKWINAKERKNLWVLLFVLVLLVWFFVVVVLGKNHQSYIQDLNNSQAPAAVVSPSYAGAGEKCGVYNPSEPTKDCQPGYHCQLENKQLPDLGGTCEAD